MDAQPSHTDTAAYVIGALDPPDAEAFEWHLRDCRRCQFELTEFGAVPDLVDEAIACGLVASASAAMPLIAPDPEPAESDLRELLSIVDARRRNQALLYLFGATAAAIVVIVAALLTIGAALHTNRSAPDTGVTTISGTFLSRDEGGSTA